MTPTSLLPKIAAAAGYGFAELCEAIVQTATLHVGHAPRARAEAVTLEATGADAVAIAV
jgi:D-alanine-D-alanine ligase